MANVTATNFPTIVRCRVFQKSTAEPGSVVLYTDHETDAVPDLTTLTITSTAFTGTWSDLRVMKRARLSKDLLCWVLRDSRWKLDEAIMAESFNRRDDLGRIESATSKTITQLWAEIATATGLSITVGTVPSFQPPAPWKGKTAREAAEQLLCDSVCFMLWDAEASTYRIESAGSGALPDLSFRTYSPGPQQQIAQINVESDPIVYEAAVDAEAVMKDSSGDIVTLGSLVTAIDLFNGFKDITDLEHRSRYQQSAFRLWRVTDTAHPSALTQEKLVFLEQRATSLISGASNHLSAAAHPASDTYALLDVPGFQFVNTASDNDSEITLHVLDGTEVLYSDVPILVVDSDGVLQEAIKIHTAYNVEENGNLKRDQETRAVNASGDTLRVVVPWIRPFDSDLPDKPTGTDQWAGLLSSVADALQTKWQSQRQTASIDDIDGAYTGQVGAVLHEASAGYDGNLRTTWAFNFVPSDWRDLRG